MMSMRYAVLADSAEPLACQSPVPQSPGATSSSSSAQSATEEDVQWARFHIVQSKDESERMISYCSSVAFSQDPSRSGEGLPPLHGSACQKCCRSAPKSPRARLLEARGL